MQPLESNSGAPPPARPPAAGLDVTVTRSGDYGTTVGTQTVTIPTSGTATLAVATSDDATDEPDGSVTSTFDAGSVYTVSATHSTAAAVADNDDPPPGD